MSIVSDSELDARQLTREETNLVPSAGSETGKGQLTSNHGTWHEFSAQGRGNWNCIREGCQVGRMGFSVGTLFRLNLKR